MRIAVIDIGSNSVRLMIAEKTPDKVKSLRGELLTTRLGQGMGQRPFLEPQAMDRTVGALLHFQTIIEETGAEQVIVAATSAVRDAVNQKEFLALVKERLGLEVRVLSGPEEAELSYLGAVKGLPDAARRPVVIDIGGGSTEFIWPEAEQIRFASTQVGAVRMTEMGADSDLISRVLQDTLLSVRKNDFDRLIGVGGTVTTLAAVDQALAPYDPDRIHGYFLRRSQIEAILRRLEGMPAETRKGLAGLQPERADIIVAGTKILLSILEGLDVDGITVSETDILYGLAYRA